MKQKDVERQGDNATRLFDAQAWYLARLIFVESWHRSEFGHYLDLLRQGHSEPEAFAASFKVSYEDLDRQIVASLHEHAHVYILPMPPDPEAGGASAQPLSAAEWHARLAGLYALYERPEEAARLAQEALRTEPDNQSALRALARAQLESHDYAQALASAARISVTGATVDACLDRARVFAGLAQAAAQGDANLPLDAAALRQRAREDYERVLSADAGNRAARHALAELGGAG
jgi:tetratricopeptide (TPR) repeat protein